MGAYVRAQSADTKLMTPAEIYEKHLVPALFAPWAKLVLSGRAPAEGQSALDVACGTGVGRSPAGGSCRAAGVCHRRR